MSELTTASSLIHVDQLIQWLDYKPGQVRRAEHWLINNEIPYFLGKGGIPCTTVEAINAKLFGKEPSNEEIEF